MKKNIVIAIIIIIAFGTGYFLRGNGDMETVTHEHEHTAPLSSETPDSSKKKAEVWTCSMHPQIRLPEAGQCPICGMDLILASSGETDDDEGPRELKLSPKAIKLAEIQTTAVERKFVTAEIRMVGKVDFDETRIGYITAWVPGRLDRLYVDYTGVSVKKGDHMVYLYSPELLTAQEELIQAVKTRMNLEKSASKRTKNMVLDTLEAARDKLRLYGLTKNQIDKIEKQGKPSDHMTIYSPMSGIVIHKNGIEGMYVKTGSKIYTIADLSQVWVKLDAYESDLSWLRYGQEVEFYTEAYPGETFKGRILFIDPVLNAKTRTVKVRVNVPNPDGRLKPEMFIRALVRPMVAAGGKVMDPALAGKWISPMHPEIVKDKPGSCDICGMPLVRAESLGYVTPDETTDKSEVKAPLVIPASAPLITGKKAVVYVEIPEKQGRYEGRKVVLGPRTGNYYHVLDGLSEGELVVTNGNFKIDSAVQILAKPSMMNPEGGVALSGHAHHGDIAMTKTGETVGKKHDEKNNKGMSHSTSDGDAFDVPEAFRKQVGEVQEAYFRIQQALSKDDFNTATKESKGMKDKLGKVEMMLLTGHPHMAWMKESEVLGKSIDEFAGAKDISEARSIFIRISDTLYAITKKFGVGGQKSILRFYCPMVANGKGAYWLQNKPGTENPYFGSAMFKCGSQEESISP